METIYTLNVRKIRGNPLITKLRIIQLFEADFNAALKIKIGRQLMSASEALGFLGDDMHGGLNNHSAQTAILTQQLTCNVSQQYRTPCSILVLDDSKCFDRIFPNIVSITLQRIGSPKEMYSSLMKKLLR